VEIRSFQPTDEAAVLELWGRTLVRDPLTPGRFQQMVLLDVNFDAEGCLVAVEGGRVVGFALGLVRREPMPGIGLQPDTGWITAFFVAPDCQGQGTGARMIGDLLQFFERRGRRHVLVSPYTPHYFFPGVDVDAYPGGVRLLERLGFRETSRVVGMSRRLLDFTVPDEVRESEAQAAQRGIRVRFCDRAYLQSLLEFLDRDFPGDWPRVIRERVRQGVEWDDILIAERDGEVLGYCQYDGERFGPFGVADAARGQRLGTILFYRGVERMKAKGRRHLWLAWTGGDAQRFYQRHGLTVDRRHAIMRRDI
jgi:mycothiol synthase